MLAQIIKSDRVVLIQFIGLAKVGEILISLILGIAEVRKAEQGLDIFGVLSVIRV